jgi:hypothetical protein
MTGLLHGFVGCGQKHTSCCLSCYELMCEWCSCVSIPMHLSYRCWVGAMLQGMGRKALSWVQWCSGCHAKTKNHVGACSGSCCCMCWGAACTVLWHMLDAVVAAVSSPKERLLQSGIPTLMALLRPWFEQRCTWPCLLLYVVSFQVNPTLLQQEHTQLVACVAL